MNQKEKNICQEYLSILERLHETVQEQTVCLKKNDREKLTLLFGKKENIYHSLKQMDKNGLGTIDENEKQSRRFKNKTKKLINTILAIENTNKKLIADSMDRIGMELSELNSIRTRCRTYLDSDVKERKTGVNLVS